ncbi:MAG: bacillithiol system redox-active protein YtxJ [Flavobacteriaceae bacterium]|nr:bacillithiol system redox-active protein YtxJ [Flavobacteriaceae bacterium]
MTSNKEWNQISDLSDLKLIKQESNKKKVLIFKHSTRCGTSRMVLRSFETKLTELNKNYELYYLDLLQYRAISNAIEAEFQVKHESPQLLIIENEKAVNSAAHYDIIELTELMVKG